MTAKKTRKSMAKADAAYILRCCDKNLRSYGGFQWPESGLVEAPDWSPRAECGHGLHGWLWGEGRVGVSGNLHTDPEARWIVARVVRSEVVDLAGKVKFPRAWVEMVGTREAAVQRMCELAGVGRKIIYGTATAGDEGLVAIRWWDESRCRYRLAVGYVGEDGIEPGVAYVVVDGKLAKKGGAL